MVVVCCPLFVVVCLYDACCFVFGVSCLLSCCLVCVVRECFFVVGCWSLFIFVACLMLCVL